MMLRSAERRKVRLIIREIIFLRIPTRAITIHQRYRRTGGQTGGRTDGQLTMTIPRYATLDLIGLDWVR